MDPSGQFVVPQVRKQYLNQTEKYISFPIYRRLGVIKRSIASSFTAKHQENFKKNMKD